jgi:prepilin-type N-terminal cleavage/methylation domain-containing protein
MLRRAFTLIELLVIVAIIGILVTVSVVSVQRGQQAARMRGTVRDVFAAVRQARSLALVTQKPCIITFSTQSADDSVVSKVEITSAELLKSTTATRARTLDGRWITIGGEDESAGTDGAAAVGDGGHTVEEMLFQPISQEVLEGIRIKVVMDDEDVETSPGEVNEAKKSSISVFSNVDYLLGAYREEREKQKAAESAAAEKEQKENDATGAATPAADEEDCEKSLAWQVNGRCDPHTIYIYADGADWQRDAWRIRVDRFGAAKILDADEEDRR